MDPGRLAHGQVGVGVAPKALTVSLIRKTPWCKRTREFYVTG